MVFLSFGLESVEVKISLLMAPVDLHLSHQKRYIAFMSKQHYIVYLLYVYFEKICLAHRHRTDTHEDRNSKHRHFVSLQDRQNTSRTDLAAKFC